jgi:hypothetical protein
VNYKVAFNRAVSQRMVDTLGLDLALRLLSKVRGLLEKQADQLRTNRDPADPACFVIRVPLVTMAKGGWYDCQFAVEDQSAGHLRVAGFTADFRAIGPM